MEARRCGMLPVLRVSQGEQRLVLCVTTDVSTVLLPLRTDICRQCLVHRFFTGSFPRSLGRLQAFRRWLLAATPGQL